MSPKTTKEIKQGMALPPIPMAPAKGRGERNRNRNRIRMEISVEQCDAFVSMLGERLRSTAKTDPSFKGLYSLYFQLKSQSDKLASKEAK